MLDADPVPDLIAVYPDALPAALCDEVVARFRASSVAHPGRTGHGLDRTKKDSLDLTVSHHREWDDVTRRVTDVTLARLADYARTYPALLTGALSPAVVEPATGRPVTIDLGNFATLGAAIAGALLERLYRLGDLNVQRYAQGSGGYHHWHSEVYPLDATAEHLHRVLFFQYYLNDVAEGGETEFLHQRRKVRPARGTLLVAPAGFTHTHKGHVPRSSEKLILTSWVLFQRAEALYGADRVGRVTPP